MAKLDSGRMSNATKLRAVDNAHNQLELDLEGILGIPDGQNITGSIFGLNPDDDVPVRADGSIRGILKLLTAATVYDPEDGIGFQFEDDTETKRLTLIEGRLRIHRLNGAVWDLVSELDVSGSVAFQGLLDVDIPVGEEFAPGTPNPDAAGKFVAVNATGDAYTHVAPPADGGATAFTGLADTPEEMGPAHSMLLTDGAALYFEKTPANVEPWGVWLYSDPVTLADGVVTSINRLNAKSTLYGWDTPTIFGKTSVAIPHAGFFHVVVRTHPDTFQGHQTLWLENITDDPPVIGPITVPTYHGGLAKYSGDDPPLIMNNNALGPHFSGFFACKKATRIFFKMFYEGAADDISIMLDLSIVKVG